MKQFPDGEQSSQVVILKDRIFKRKNAGTRSSLKFPGMSKIKVKTENFLKSMLGWVAHPPKYGE